MKITSLSERGRPWVDTREVVREAVSKEGQQGVRGRRPAGCSFYLLNFAPRGYEILPKQGWKTYRIREETLGLLIIALCTLPAGAVHPHVLK